MAPACVPLYIPQGVLILPQEKERVLATTAARTRRRHRRTVAVDPFAPVEHEPLYATSTRQVWPASWRSATDSDPAFRVATTRILGALCRAKDAQETTEARVEVERDDMMDVAIKTTGMGLAMDDAWARAKAADEAGRLATWAATQPLGASGIFDVAALGIAPFGLQEPVPARARRVVGRDAARPPGVSLSKIRLSTSDAPP